MVWKYFIFRINHFYFSFHTLWLSHFVQNVGVFRRIRLIQSCKIGIYFHIWIRSFSSQPFFYIVGQVAAPKKSNLSRWRFFTWQFQKTVVITFYAAESPLATRCLNCLISVVYCCIHVSATVTKQRLKYFEFLKSCRKPSLEHVTQSIIWSAVSYLDTQHLAYLFFSFNCFFILCIRSLKMSTIQKISRIFQFFMTHPQITKFNNDFWSSGLQNIKNVQCHLCFYDHYENVEITLKNRY